MPLRAVYRAPSLQDPTGSHGMSAYISVVRRMPCNVQLDNFTIAQTSGCNICIEYQSKQALDTLTLCTTGLLFMVTMGKTLWNCRS